MKQFPKFARGFGLHSAGLGNGKLLPCSCSWFAASMSRCNFPPGSASFFICRSQLSSSAGFSRAASSARSSGVSFSMAALISSTRLTSRIYPLMRPRTRGDQLYAFDDDHVCFGGALAHFARLAVFFAVEPFFGALHRFELENHDA